MNRKIVLVTGMSGAGKSSAMNALEDMGYYCIDNFPKELLPQLDELLDTRSSQYPYVALSVSALDYLDFVTYFKNLTEPISIVFLDFRNEELLLRYRFTRRHHPMIASNKATTLEEAIEIERDLFDHLQESAGNTIHIDTTKLSSASLAKRIRHRFQKFQSSPFTITFQSFGFKHGVPMDADMVIDVRFLPNPFYEPALREKTGNQKEVSYLPPVSPDGCGAAVGPRCQNQWPRQKLSGAAQRRFREVQLHRLDCLPACQPAR